jgi:hypothetical protein
MIGTGRGILLILLSVGSVLHCGTAPTQDFQIAQANKRPNLLFWEQEQGYYKLDEHAYAFVGLPFAADTSNVTVAIIDGWDDGHGQTVEAIIRRGAKNATIWRMDFVFQSATHARQIPWAHTSIASRTSSLISSKQRLHNRAQWSSI